MKVTKTICDICNLEKPVTTFYYHKSRCDIHRLDNMSMTKSVSSPKVTEDICYDCLTLILAKYSDFVANEKYKTAKI